MLLVRLDRISRTFWWLPSGEEDRIFSSIVEANAPKIGKRRRSCFRGGDKRKTEIGPAWGLTINSWVVIHATIRKNQRKSPNHRPFILSWWKKCETIIFPEIGKPNTANKFGEEEKQYKTDQRSLHPHKSPRATRATMIMTVWINRMRTPIVGSLFAYPNFIHCTIPRLDPEKLRWITHPREKMADSLFPDFDWFVMRSIDRIYPDKTRFLPTRAFEIIICYMISSVETGTGSHVAVRNLHRVPFRGFCGRQ